MYPNLRAEMARRRMTVREMSEKTGIKLGTLQKKMAGKSPFLITEALIISDALDGISVDYLFSTKGGD